MSTLSCENLTKKYGKKTALTDVTLTIEPHRIYGLVGRNGAGKTTLLSLLSAQSKETGGTVTYGGEKIWENQNALNEICFSREINTSILFGSDNRKISTLLKIAAFMFPYWDKDYAAQLIEEFKLNTKERLTKQSKGMLSAVTIIIALASKAPMTFLDEPVAGLDVFMRDRFYKLLLEEYTRTERTFIVSTHIIDEAANMLEDVIILDEGRVLLSENTEELLSRYRIVSGKDSEIDEFCKGFKIVHSESLGRQKSVCIEIKDRQAFEATVEKYDFDVTKAGLQKLFIELLQGGEGQ